MVLCCACVHSVYAACEKTSIEYKGTQEMSDDEFLYESGFEFAMSSGYECDNEFCEDGTTVTMFPGHYYKGEQVDETVTYKCSTGLEDKWEAVSNDVSGDIVATRWCNNATKAGEMSLLYQDTDPELFERFKSELESAYDNNKYVTQISVYCTNDGWANPRVERCVAPYVANRDGLCEHYTTYLTNNLESYYGMSYDEHKNVSGMSDADYYNYRQGIDDMDTLIPLMLQDITLGGLFTY